MESINILKNGDVEVTTKTYIVSTYPDQPLFNLDEAEALADVSGGTVKVEETTHFITKSVKTATLRLCKRLEFFSEYSDSSEDWSLIRLKEFEAVSGSDWERAYIS